MTGLNIYILCATQTINPFNSFIMGKHACPPVQLGAGYNPLPERVDMKCIFYRIFISSMSVLISDTFALLMRDNDDKHDVFVLFVRSKIVDSFLTAFMSLSSHYTGRNRKFLYIGKTIEIIT